MTLQQYIALVGGDEAAAKIFGVTPRAVQSWRLGDRIPRPKQAQSIINATKGRVDWAGIYSMRVSEQ